MIKKISDTILWNHSWESKKCHKIERCNLSSNFNHKKPVKEGDERKKERVKLENLSYIDMYFSHFKLKWKKKGANEINPERLSIIT